MAEETNKQETENGEEKCESALQFILLSMIKYI